MIHEPFDALFMIDTALLENHLNLSVFYSIGKGDLGTVAAFYLLCILIAEPTAKKSDLRKDFEDTFCALKRAAMNSNVNAPLKENLEISSI